MNIPKTQNAGYGFFGTMASYGANAQVEWDKAFSFIKSMKFVVDGKSATEDEIRGYLDSTSGRHLADAVEDLGSIEKVNESRPLISKWGFLNTVRAFRKESW